MKSGQDSCGPRWGLCDRLLAAHECARLHEEQEERRRRFGMEKKSPQRRVICGGKMKKCSQKLTQPAASHMLLMVVLMALALALQIQADDSSRQKPATQPSIDRQVGAAAVASSTSPSQPAKAAAAAAPSVSGSTKPTRQSASQQKKAAAMAAQQSYDRHQLKASPSHASSAQAAAQAQAAPSDRKPSDPERATLTNDERQDQRQQASEHKSKGSLAKAQAPTPLKPTSGGGFSLWRKLFPSFMGSAAAAAAVAGASASAAAEAHKHNMPNANQQHSRSSLDGAPTAPSSLLPAKLASYFSGASKKRNGAATSLIPDHAPVFMRQKVASDRQGGPAALAGIASGLLSNPLGLGLLFSAPLLPSLLLTPLAIAGLSPAMSAINNFFGDDEDEAKPAATSGGPFSGPLAAFMGSNAGSSSPLASILQQASGGGGGGGSATGGSSSESAASGSSPASSLALRTFQTLLGPTSTTERPLFKPGMFASQASASGIQNSFANLAASANSQQPQRASGLFSSGGGGSGGAGSSLIQTAASMISPTFAAPPSSGSSSADDDGPGLMQMASDMFERVASLMGNTQTGVESNKDIGQASGSQASASSSQPSNSPLSTLVSLSNLSPFQLSNLFAGSPLGAAASSPSSSSSGAGAPQKAGFFSTLRNVYALFSSSFLRRQADGSDSNECQQRLICELHQRAMGSKLFKRSLQANLMELAALDKNLLEQIKYSASGIPAMQARVDADTKAMLNDFLKATNNFKSGREMVNCGQMFPKCSRVQLLAAANAHLSDPVNGRAIGKFSQLMKKMKFKSNQQHQSQWKLRKPNKLVPQQQQQQQGRQVAASQPIDYLQVAPLSPTLVSAPGKPSQLTPADSLKLVQQIMLMSQQQQQQQQQPQQSASSVGAPLIAQQYSGIQQQPVVASQQQQQQQYSYSQYQPQQQYSQMPQKQTTYTDAIGPYTSATESPYYAQAQQYTNPPTMIDNYYNQQQVRVQQQPQNTIGQTVNQAQQAYYSPPAPAEQQQQQMQQQQSSVQEKSRPMQQQQPTSGPIVKQAA